MAFYLKFASLGFVRVTGTGFIARVGSPACVVLGVVWGTGSRAGCGTPGGTRGAGLHAGLAISSLGRCQAKPFGGVPDNVSRGGWNTRGFPVVFGSLCVYIYIYI